MIGTKFTYEGREFTVAQRSSPRSYECASQAGDSINLSTRALNKLLGRTATKPAVALSEDTAAIQIESVLLELEDPLAQIRIVRDLAIKYLDTQPLSQPA